MHIHIFWANRKEQHLHCSWFRKDISVNMHHEVPTSGILHYKAHMIFGLETSKEVHQKGVPYTVHSFKNPLLAHQTGKKKKCFRLVKHSLELILNQIQDS